MAEELDKRLQVETDGNENKDSGNAILPSNGEDTKKDHTLSIGGEGADPVPIKGAQDRTIHVGNVSLVGVLRIQLRFYKVITY